MSDVVCRRNDSAAMVKLRREHSRIDGELCREASEAREPASAKAVAKIGEAKSDRKPNWNGGTPHRYFSYEATP